MKSTEKPPARGSGAKQLATAKADAERIDRELAPAQDVAKAPVVAAERIVLTEEDQAVISGCRGADSQAVVQMILDTLIPILGRDLREIGGSQRWLLDGIKAICESEQPATGLQGLLITQALSSHALALHFAKKALTMLDSEIADRYAARSQRLMALFAQQLEALSRLKGAPAQRIQVEHLNLNVAAGGKAVLAGQINTSSGDGEGV